LCNFTKKKSTTSYDMTRKTIINDDKDTLFSVAVCEDNKSPA
jgi:hypothetical protein